MKKKILSLMLMMSLAASLAACGQDSGKNSNNTDLSKTETEASSGQTGEEETTLVYGSADYTRINPAMDEHGEINLLLFNGLTAHDADDNIVPGLAEKWEYDAETCTYTFHIRDGIQWHDGEKFTADDVKFTIEAIMDPENGSENAPNYEDVEEITVIDDSTVSFRLSEPNVAFLEYMTMAILPKHLLEGENMQESDFFRAPVGTGPYKLESWDEGQSIVLVKNEDYYLGAPKIDKVIFKIVPDDNAQAMQLESGELDLALLDPKNAQNFKEKDGFTCYDMTTADYRGILFNFANDYWTKNRDIIPAVCYSIDRQAIIDSVLLGEGMAAYSPLQRNIYNNENVEHYDYNPEKSKELLKEAGYPDGVTIEFYYGTYGSNKDIAELLQSQAAAAGFNLTLCPTDGASVKQLWASYNEDTPAGIRMNELGHPKPSPYIQMDYTFGQNALQNSSKWFSDDLAALLKEISQTTDETAQNEKLTQLQEMVEQEIPIVSLYTAYKFSAYRTWVEGLKYNGEGTMIFTEAWLNK